MWLQTSIQLRSLSPCVLILLPPWFIVVWRFRVCIFIEIVCLVLGGNLYNYWGLKDTATKQRFVCNICFCPKYRYACVWIFECLKKFKHLNLWMFECLNIWTYFQTLYVSMFEGFNVWMFESLNLSPCVLTPVSPWYILVCRLRVCVHSTVSHPSF